MKDANGSRFELLLGAADWGRCTRTGDDGVVRSIASEWADPATRRRSPLAFDDASGALSLARRLSRFRAAPSDLPPDPARRLGAAADSFGSVYAVVDGGARIDVLAIGSRRTSLYARADGAAGVASVMHGDFAPLKPAEPAVPRALRGLAVTREHYLVAGVQPLAGIPGGLLVFDLPGGGPALPLAWPAAWPFEPQDLAPRPGGGLAVLDRTHRRVWMLDRRLGMHAVFTVEAPEPARPGDF